MLYRKFEILGNGLASYLSFLFNNVHFSQIPIGYMLKTTELLNLALVFPLLKPIACD